MRIELGPNGVSLFCYFAAHILQCCILYLYIKKKIRKKKQNKQKYSHWLFRFICTYSTKCCVLRTALKVWYRCSVLMAIILRWYEQRCRCTIFFFFIFLLLLLAYCNNFSVEWNIIDRCQKRWWTWNENWEKIEGRWECEINERLHFA